MPDAEIVAGASVPDLQRGDVERLRLRDGFEVRVRPIRPDDGQLIRDLHGRLSSATAYARFFSAHPFLSDDEVEHFTHVDDERRYALVAVAVTDDRLVAVARYEWLEEHVAEVAFVVEDAVQGHGLSPLLLDRLVAHARRYGIRTIRAQTLVTNQAMLAVLRRSGYPLHSAFDGGVAVVDLDVSDPEADREAAVGRSLAAQPA